MVKESKLGQEMEQHLKDNGKIICHMGKESLQK